MAADRDQFGNFRDDTRDTARQLLFRGEKRRRYCVIVGDLQSTTRHVTLKLFGHRGPKPFRLQNKLIRLVNLSIGKPRRPPAGIGELMADIEGGGDADTLHDADGATGPAARLERERQYVEAGFDVEDGVASETAEGEATDEATRHVDPATAAPHRPDGGNATGGHALALPVGVDKAEDSLSPKEVSSASQKNISAAGKSLGEVEGEDVDHYIDMEDEVVPLTVQQAGTTTSVLHEHNLANSPVLTAKRFSSLRDYFLREFRFLLTLDDVCTQNVSVKINLGAAYCCLARQGSYSTPLKHATFGEFVERMNVESMQLYFIKDCPACVSRAVDMESGSLRFPANSTIVKINFFSNERQSRSIARAIWDSQTNMFQLLDVENVGVTFNWTVFALDESFVRRKRKSDSGSHGVESSTAPPAVGAPLGGPTAPAGEEGDKAAESPDDEDDLARNKTIAYPFEVEFRAFRRWKQQADNPAAPLAKAILEELSLAEHNYLSHGSSAAYERMDLTNVCEMDYAAEDFNVESIVVEQTSRVKPEGTDLLVDNTTSLFIENFAAARQLKQKVTMYGPLKVAAMQNASNNNYMRGVAGEKHHRGRGPGPSDGLQLNPDQIEEVLRPTSKLTFFRSRGSTIHWKLHPHSNVEENIAPMTEALAFLQQVLHTANDIERTSARGGAAPDAL